MVLQAAWVPDFSQAVGLWADQGIPQQGQQGSTGSDPFAFSQLRHSLFHQDFFNIILSSLPRFPRWSVSGLPTERPYMFVMSVLPSHTMLFDFLSVLVGRLLKSTDFESHCVMLSGTHYEG